MKTDFFAGKRVLIMGLGRFGGGVDVAKFACSAGANVTITDLAPHEQLSGSIDQLNELPEIEFHLGSHDERDFAQADVVVANPAVPLDNKYLEIARQNAATVTSQISIFFQLSPALIIGITGANGKSTTAVLTAHLLKAGLGQQGFKYRKVWLSGNIGNEPLLSNIKQIEANDLVVLELSSFQIEQLAQIKKAPRVALLTNLVPNHLDRYGTFSRYCSAKESIFKFQQLSEDNPAVSMFNTNDKVGIEWFEKYGSDKGRVCLKFSADDINEQIRQRFTLPGRANLANLAAASSIARHFGVTDQTILNALPQFKTLRHRLELVAERKGVRWYNDSKATTPESAIAAIEAFEEPEIIIAGGYDKNLPFDELGRKIAQKAKAAILIGATAPRIAEAIQQCPENHTKIEFADSLAHAVEKADKIAAPADVVMLSPACASYDMFRNFQHRGHEFTELVNQLASQ